jgi:hypothetical protein
MEVNLDNQARNSYKESASSVIYYICLASYLYYIRDESVLSDEVFDKLCKLVIDKNIKHKLLSHLITEDRMRAGSLFDVKANQYPVFIVRDAEILIRNNIWYGEKL